MQKFIKSCHLERNCRTAKNYPIYSRHHPGKFDQNGNPYVVYLPSDIFRNYDEAHYRVIQRRLKAGHLIPRAG